LILLTDGYVDVIHAISNAIDVKLMIDSLSPIHEHHKLRYTAFVEDPIWLPYNPSEMIELTRKLIGASHPEQQA
jgi:hypothetical protein